MRPDPDVDVDVDVESRLDTRWAGGPRLTLAGGSRMGRASERAASPVLRIISGSKPHAEDGRRDSTSVS